MKCHELFKHIREIESWFETGSNMDWITEVDHDHRIIRLLFKETDSTFDWLQNLSFFSKVYKKQVSKFLAHRGFVNQYKTANDAIMENLLQKVEEFPEYTVVICGWSSGGAYSQIAAEDFNYRTRTNRSNPNTGRKAVLVTFGAPKVFVGEKSRKYVLSCCQKVIQVAHRNDSITYVPPFPWFKHLLLSKKLRIGEKFSLRKFFNPWESHTLYDQYDLYKVDGPLGNEEL